MKREIGTMFFKRVLDSEDLDQLLQILDKIDVKNVVESKIDELWSSAISQLTEVSKGDVLPLKSLLTWLALRGK